MNLVLINSVTNPLPGSVNTGVPRSFFSGDQRFQQTLKTLESCMSKIPQAQCILIEGSELTPEQKAEYEKRCLLLDCSQLPMCRKYIECQNKSMGECVKVLTAVKFILDHNIPFHVLYKVCARNTLNEHFKIPTDDETPEKKFFVRQFTNGNHSWYTSSGYMIGWEQRHTYFDILRQSLQAMEENKITDMETNLATWIPKQDIVFRNPMGISGFAGACGTPFEH
jgi:hypothetical protein